MIDTPLAIDSTNNVKSIQEKTKTTSEHFKSILAFLNSHLYVLCHCSFIQTSFLQRAVSVINVYPSSEELEISKLFFHTVLNSL